MRHRRRGRKLGRTPSHQRALLRNLASALFLTERDAEGDDNAPKVKGRIITTLAEGQGSPPAGREVHHHRPPRACRPWTRPAGTAPQAERNTEAWKTWRKSDQWQQVERGHRPGRHRPPPLPACCWATSRPCGSCSRPSPRASPTAPAATPASCGWPSRAWATPARGPSWSSSASTIAWFAGAGAQVRDSAQRGAGDGWRIAFVVPPLGGKLFAA